MIRVLEEHADKQAEAYVALIKAVRKYGPKSPEVRLLQQAMRKAYGQQRRATL